MDTQTSAPTHPAYAGLKKAVDTTAAQLGCTPASLVADDVDGKRVAVITFDGLDYLEAWATWLHWPWAHSSRDGQHIGRAYGQWAGYAVTLEAAEPLTPVTGEL